MNEKTNIIQYISDPMCPWCYAFTPIFARLKSEYMGSFSFTYIAGGLRVRPDEPPMNEEFKDMLAGYWETVELETGHKFNIDLVDIMDFAFNTEPSCRAMVSFRHLYPDKIFEFEKNLLTAFYEQGLDLTILKTFTNIVRSMGLDHAKYNETFDSGEIDDQLEQDLIYTKSFEKPLLPMIVIPDGKGKNLIMRGYTEYKQVRESLDKFLCDSQGICETTTGPACDPENGCLDNE